MGSFDRMPEGYDGLPPQHEIKCRAQWGGGSERHTHRTADEVRRCYKAQEDARAGTEVWPCSWHLEGRYDDGSKFEYPCGLPTRFTGEDGSYECDGGHGFVPAQARFEQGWDYTDDPEEALGLMKHGVRPVQPDGKSWF